MALAESFAREVETRLLLAAHTVSETRTRAENALWQLYELSEKPAPAVIWCQSLYQLITLPSLIVGLMHSDVWQVCAPAMEDRQVDDTWMTDFEEAWTGLWTHGGYQILKGMKKTSRLNHEGYWKLETALIEQCRQQIMQCLQTGKLKTFDDSLNKEKIYRLFWGLHLWHINFLQDRLRYLGSSIDESFVAERTSNESKWVQFAPFDERLRRLFGAATGSLNALITMMGAEPASQLRHLIWLPTGFPQVASAQMWRDHAVADGLPGYEEDIAAWNELGSQVFAVIALDHLAFVCEKPTIFSLDEGGRLHSDNGPAIVFRDGFRMHFWHGVVVEPRIIYDPETISLDEIANTQNIELRRVLIERYGQPRYLADCGAVVVQEDECGVLLRQEIEGDEPLLMVKVINSTAEPDGSFREYFLRVPPDTETARQGIAWTFGIEDAQDYGPLQET